MKKLIVTCAMITTFSTTCMESNIRIKQKGDVLIRTSDNQLFSLPQRHVEASRLLQTKQELLAFNLKCPIAHIYPFTLHTINSDQLTLFSDALDAQNFNAHFHKKLTPEQRKRLTCLAGVTELDSSMLTIKLLGAYFKPEIIETFIYPHFPEIRTIQNHLKRSVIIDNVSFTGRFTQTTCSYVDNPCMATRSDGSYNFIPALLQSKNYDGYTTDIKGDFANAQWQINYIKVIRPTEICTITPVEPFTPEKPQSSILNKKNLWLENRTTKTNVIKKVIEHTNEVNKILFSNDGNYLATSSYEPNSELMLTNLTEAKNMPAFSHIFLTGHAGEIGALCFNNRSTLLAVGSENGIQLWNIKEGTLLKKIDCPQDGMIVSNLEFNNDDTRLAAGIPIRTAITYTILLLDTSDLTAIDTIATIPIIAREVNALKFNSYTNSLMITTTKNVLIVNGLSGKKIIETESIPDHDAHFCFQTAVLMPNVNLLATATLTTEKHCDTRLWDISSKKLIATLLRDASSINGVGVTDDNRSVISTSPDYSMTKTDLYDDNAAACFNWIINKTDLLQKYLLLRLYRAQQTGEIVNLHPNSTEYRTLHNVPTKPCNVKNMVEKYLLKKKIGK